MIAAERIGLAAARRRRVSGALGLWMLAATATTAMARQEPRPGEDAGPPAGLRVVSLAPSITEMLFAIGAGPSVVGVTEVCNYPPEAAALPKIGLTTAETLNLEQIVAFRPDLVVSFEGGPKLIVEALKRLKVRVAVVETYSVEDVLRAIRDLGRLTGHEDGAASVVAEMRERMDRVRSRLAGLPAGRRPRVFYQVWDTPLMTAGPSSFIGQLIELAGGVNVFSDLEQHYAQISEELVVARNPEVILGPNRHGQPVTVRQITERTAWGHVSAVRSGRIYLLDGDVVSRPGPRLVEALEAIARYLHPDRFPREPSGTVGDGTPPPEDQP